MTFKHCSVDIETYSDIDIKKAGLYKYARSPEFRVLLIAYAVDNGPVQIIDLTMDAGAEGAGTNTVHWQEFLARWHDPFTIMHSYNAAFEAAALNIFMGHQGVAPIPLSRWRCTMAHGLYCGYTAGLAATGEAMGLPQDKRKMGIGQALIRKFCVPQKGTKTRPGVHRIMPSDEPEKWELFKTYCCQDVTTEREIERRLSRWPMPDREQKLWELTTEANELGVGVDMDMVRGALDLADEEQKKLETEAREISGLQNPKSVQQLMKWLNEELNTDEETEVKDLRKATVSDLLAAGVDSDKATRMLELRQLMSKTSTKKYNAIEAAVCQDDRVRGMMFYYGANRTGRWCLTGDHEVLTPEGWKRLDEWTGGNIACWNPTSSAISFQTAESVSFDYCGPMYTYQDNRIDQCSTPDHKMRVQKRWGDPWQDLTVEQMAQCRPRIPMNGYRYHRGCANPAWLRVLIMTQADGFYTPDGSVRFNFKKERKIDRCKHLLRKAEIPFMVYPHGEVTAIDVPARAVPLWLREFRTKTFGFWLLDENPDIFFEELPNWDGYYPAPNSIQYSTCNKQNADIVQALAHMSGRCACIRTKKHSEKHPKWNDAYVVDIWLTPGESHEIRTKPTINDYEGKVYCAVTPTGYFLVRRGGKAWITGNSGRLVQMQNLPQNHLPGLDFARKCVEKHDAEMVNVCWGSVPNTLSQLIRTAFVPSPGKIYAVADYSAIEARVVAWLAGEEAVLKAFREGKDIYCEMASQMFGVPVEKHGQNADLRQKGKVAILACIAEGQPVLTDRGLVPIEQVGITDQLWDGESWVHHNGVIYKGEREVITYEGLTATPDHLVWVEGQPEPVQFGVAAASGAHLVRTRSKTDGITTDKRTARLYDIRDAGPHHRFTVSGCLVHNCGYGGGESALIAMGALKMGLTEDELPEIKQKWRQANPSICRLWNIVEAKAIAAVETGRPQVLSLKEYDPERARMNESLMGADPGSYSNWFRTGVDLAVFRREVDRATGQDFLTVQLPAGRKLFYAHPHLSPAKNIPDKQSLHYYGTEQATKKWGTVDTWGGKIVENCVAEGTLILTDRGRIPIEQIRSEHRIWDGYEFVKHDGLINQGKQMTISVDGIRVTPDHKILTEKGWVKGDESGGLNWAAVPVPYRPAPTGFQVPDRITVHKTEHTEIVFDIRNCGPRHRFTVYDPSTGKYRIVSNCTQAVARDCLAETLIRLREIGLVAAFSVHDEVIVEVDKEEQLQDILDIMARPLDWAPGLPLKGAGFTCAYYQKD